ncbi:MAG TPA: tetratricopeptide repeat protein [Rectinemataceae bacterium]|nr:tetratricopeptide repeat protein [Rectinemataceae bacterium]
MSPLVPVLAIVVLLGFIAIIMSSILSRPKDGKAQAGAPGKSKGKTRDRAQVLKEATRKLAANPKDFEALGAIAGVAWSDQDWEKAFKYYSELVDCGAGNPEVDEFMANARLGFSSLRLNRLDDAYKALTIARTIRQDDFDVNFNLGYLEYQRKAYERAIGLLKQAVAMNPEHTLALRYLGHSYFRTQQFKEAIGSLKRALDLSPEDKESLFALAECNYELGGVDQALKIFSHLRTDPTFGPQAALFAGTVRLNQHLTDKAIEDFEIGLKHVEIKPETAIELKYRLTAAYIKANEIGKAVSLLGEIQVLAPGYKDVPALLAKFRELNSNRNLKVYLLGTASEFVTLCRKITLMFFPKAKVKITDISVNKNDWADVLAEIETSKWSDIVLFRYIRASGVMGELVVREFHARVKDLKAGKGFCISAGTYSDEAKKFVEARLIDLIEKDALMNILNTVEAKQRGTMAE